MGKASLNTTSEAQPFAARLRSLRLAAGLSTPQLAQRVGCNQPWIVDIEKGRKNVSWETACRFADALGVSMNAMRRETGEVPAPVPLPEPPDPWVELIERQQAQRGEKIVDKGLTS